MESFPFSQSVKERSVIKLHLCHRRLCTLFYLGVSPCLRCRTGWLLFLSLKSVGYDVVMFPTARPILYCASADFQTCFLNRNRISVRISGIQFRFYLNSVGIIPIVYGCRKYKRRCQSLRIENRRECTLRFSFCHQTVVGQRPCIW